MIFYTDSSVLLRRILAQAGALRDWKSATGTVASALVRVECFRTIDRLRIAGGLKDAEVVSARELILDLLRETEVVDPSQRVLRRASQPFPTSLGTLDAIHLATALEWHERHGEPLVLATHDVELATAARSCGLTIVGC